MASTRFKPRRPYKLLKRASRIERLVTMDAIPEWQLKATLTYVVDQGVPTSQSASALDTGSSMVHQHAITVPTSTSRLLMTEQESTVDEFMLKLNERCNTRAAYCRRMASQFMDGPDNDVFDVPRGVAHLKMVLLRQVSHEARYFHHPRLLVEGRWNSIHQQLEANRQHIKSFKTFVTSRRALQLARKNEDQFFSDALLNAHFDGFEQHETQDPAAVLPSSPPRAALRSDDAVKRVLRPRRRLLHRTEWLCVATPILVLRMSASALARAKRRPRAIG
ncbi:hypothetical protein J4E93_006374 [Alternaria ventricosa]|uniref:uncharacterized protein n=1 Tax=Alternaria ventricosa TaxID=1187951 RepID=UPI0020C4671D|nr:uncharacterized protein J4E93_006374 [Alternaria ventricosa]KAI4644471.1 hypothetical protein J4E93_006374 [Alternaria ventricosa]